MRSRPTCGMEADAKGVTATVGVGGSAAALRAKPLQLWGLYTDGESSVWNRHGARQAA